jgi:hypothetical protein
LSAGLVTVFLSLAVLGTYPCINIKWKNIKYLQVQQGRSRSHQVPVPENCRIDLSPELAVWVVSLMQVVPWIAEVG